MPPIEILVAGVESARASTSANTPFFLSAFVGSLPFSGGDEKPESEKGQRTVASANPRGGEKRKLAIRTVVQC